MAFIAMNEIKFWWLTGQLWESGLFKKSQNQCNRTNFKEEKCHVN